MSRFLEWAGRGFRHAKRLFHTLIGLLFLFLALAGASVSLNEWISYRRAPSSGLVRFALLASFTVFLVICGLYSFVKARHVR